MGLGDIIGAIGAVASGGITGIVGAGLSKIFDIWHAKQQLDQLKAQWDHEREMKKIDGELMAQEWAQRTKVAEVEGKTAETVADAGSFAKSFQLEPISYSAGLKAPEGSAFADGTRAVGWLAMVALDVIRGVIRPGLTAYLCYLTAELYDQTRAVLALMGKDADTVFMGNIYQQIVQTILYLFTTCLLWWFGTRNKQTAPKTR